jgi:hypothetical protein
LIVLVPLALVVGCGSSGLTADNSAASSQSSVTNDSLASPTDNYYPPADPPTTPVAPSPNPFQVWADGGGLADIDALSAAFTAVHESGANGTDLAATQTACGQLRDAVTAAQVYDPIPNVAAQQHWSAALDEFGKAWVDCLVGIQSLDASQITLSSTEMTAGTDELNQTNTILQTLS